MITKYCSSKKLLLKIIDNDIKVISTLGFNVIRIKLEEITKSLIFDNSKLYSEVHIKVTNNNLIQIEGLKLSMNPCQHSKFYNARIYSIDEYNKVKKIISSLKNIITVQYEIVHYDSNINHDNWW